MAHHHKSNKAVEGNPETGHGRGMPERPDEAELQEQTEEDRREVGLPADPGAARTRPEEPEESEESGEPGSG
ncbi:hypothetical protein AB0399_38395 [Streptomyces sp. NPDC088194]|uniref:hypothetical protein n=1 Tax=Streptomyces sp. NPDC088194 TaxID=3154931 RepID=UPI00344F7D31